MGADHRVLTWWLKLTHMAVRLKNQKTSCQAGRVLLGWIMLSLVWGSAFQSWSTEIVDRIVAVVNNDIVTLTELDRKIMPFEEKILDMKYPARKEREMLNKARAEMLNQLIDEKLTDQEIKRYRIEVSEKEIDDAIERIKKMNYFTDEEMEIALANEGLSMEEYRKGIKTQMLRSNLINYRVKSKIVITDEDVKAYYNEHIEEYAGETKYHLRNIIMKVSPGAGGVEKMAVKTKMELVLDKLKTGETFETMAAIYSESPLAEKGGDLGLFRIEDVSPQLQDALKDLAPGDYTPVLDTDQGYQIFYVQDIVNSEGKALEDVREGIESKLFNQIVEQKFQTWLEELRGESYIRIFE